jgi:hypothetical protein
MPGALDGLREQTLMGRADSADSPGQDFSPFGDEVAEELSVLEIDVADLFRAEFAYSLAPDTESSWTWHSWYPFSLARRSFGSGGLKKNL